MHDINMHIHTYIHTYIPDAGVKVACRVEGVVLAVFKNPIPWYGLSSGEATWPDKASGVRLGWLLTYIRPMESC